jgi:hypothetical protein
MNTKFQIDETVVYDDNFSQGVGTVVTFDGDDSCWRYKVVIRKNNEQWYNWFDEKYLRSVSEVFKYKVGDVLVASNDFLKYTIVGLHYDSSNKRYNLSPLDERGFWINESEVDTNGYKVISCEKFKVGDIVDVVCHGESNYEIILIEFDVYEKTFLYKGKSKSGMKLWFHEDDITALVAKKEEKESAMEKQVEKFAQDALKMKVEIVPLFGGDPLTFSNTAGTLSARMDKLGKLLRLQDEFSKFFDETLYCLYFPNLENDKIDCHFFVHAGVNGLEDLVANPLKELSSWINSAENFISGFMHGVEL